MCCLVLLYFSQTFISNIDLNLSFISADNLIRKVS